MTEFHYFDAPAEDSLGTLNPVFELLDYPIVMGGADDIVLTGPTPTKPLVNGREVTDPRLVEALAKPIELAREEVLDRSAKLAGILRAMGIFGQAEERIVIAEDVPPISRALSILGAVRIGLQVDDRTGASDRGGAEGSDGSEGSDGAEGSEDGVERTTVFVHTVEAPATGPGRASVKVIRSQFEGVGITVAAETANVDHAMRDSRVESAEVVPLSPDQPLILTDHDQLDARSSLKWLSAEILPEA